MRCERQMLKQQRENDFCSALPVTPAIRRRQSRQRTHCLCKHGATTPRHMLTGFFGRFFFFAPGVLALSALIFQTFNAPLQLFQHVCKAWTGFCGIVVNIEASVHTITKSFVDADTNGLRKSLRFHRIRTRIVDSRTKFHTKCLAPCHSKFISLQPPRDPRHWMAWCVCTYVVARTSPLIQSHVAQSGDGPDMREVILRIQPVTWIHYTSHVLQVQIVPARDRTAVACLTFERCQLDWTKATLHTIFSFHFCSDVQTRPKSFAFASPSATVAYEDDVVKSMTTNFCARGRLIGVFEA